MKNIFRVFHYRGVLFVAFCVFTQTLPLRAQWIQTNGPYGGNVHCLAAIGGNVVAGVWGGGIFLSTNNGTNWSAENVIHYPSTFLVCGSNLFAGAAGVFLSTDNGISWNQAGEGLNDSYVLSLAVSGSILFAGTDGGGVYLSTDNGSSWTAVDSGLTTRWVNVLLVNGINLIAGTQGGGIFRSTDNGSSWNEANEGLSNSYITSLASTGADIFAGGDAQGGGGIFRSTDNGTTWTAAWKDCGAVQALLAAPDGAGGTNLFAGLNSQGVFLSTNNGSSWIDVNAPSTRLVRALAASPTESGMNLFAGTSGGVALSTDNGSHWTVVNDGINACSISCLMKSDSNLFAGTEGNGVFLSTDYGASWNLPGGDSPLNSSIVSALGKAGPNLVVGTMGMGNYVSTDNGSNWNSILQGYSCSTFATFPSPDGLGTNIFAGTQAGVSISTDNGLHWVGPYDWPTGSSGAQNQISSLAAIDTTLFAGTLANFGDVGSLFRSTDNGVTWTESNTGLPHVDIIALAVCNHDLFAGTWGQGVFVSTDKGSTWAPKGLSDIDVNALLVAGTNIFAGTWGHGVFLSTDNGTSWSSVDSCLSNNYVSSLAINGGYLFVGTVGTSNGFGTLSLTNNSLKTGDALSVSSLLKSHNLSIGKRRDAASENNSNWTGTVWRRPLSEMITAVHEASGKELPRTFSLEQNFPNPFNPTTTISCHLPMNSFVVLKVYDVLGREVRTLVKEGQPAGIHSVVFDASSLPSGVYFYRLEAGTYHDAKKLLLLK